MGYRMQICIIAFNLCNCRPCDYANLNLSPLCNILIEDNDKEVMKYNCVTYFLLISKLRV